MSLQNDQNEAVKLLIRRCNDELNFWEQAEGKTLTKTQIEETLNKVINRDFSSRDITFTKDDLKHVRYQISQRMVQVVDIPVMLEGGRVKKWLEEWRTTKQKNRENPWELWEGYRSELIKQGKATNVIVSNEDVIDSCLDMSGDPGRDGPWESRGLVMGNVQAGKTLNYIGLINKAMDVGYKIIIVLGGHLDELRKQTQERVDEGAIGRDSNKLSGKEVFNTNIAFGVGTYGLEGRPHGGTTVDSDFGKKVVKSLGLNIAGELPVIFVIKKHYRILDNLKTWIDNFEDSRVKHRPILLIDDEADYATINTKKAGIEATKTNTSIKNLLGIFSKKTYVGYTATPFANIFIKKYDKESDRVDDDLFPKDFMISLPKNDNYCGQDYFFPDTDDDEGQKKQSPVRIIKSEEYKNWLDLKHKKDVDVIGIPKSLKEAIICFLIVIALRYQQGGKSEHNTMLVNVSRFNDVQFKVAQEIEDYLKKVKNAVIANAKLSTDEMLADQEMSLMKDIYQREYDDCGESFESIIHLMDMVCRKVNVQIVNMKAKKFNAEQAFSYRNNKKDGLWVIAVGGLKLSRGLTLEGLSVSYFLRNAVAYDTLTQMCRWYGYRPGYKEFCRLWITEDSEAHYYTVSNAIRTLYEDLRLMKLTNGTPRDFGLRVLADDLSLLITAKNKMRDATRFISNYKLWGKTIYKTRVSSSDNTNNKNHEIVSNIISSVIKENEMLDKNHNKTYLIKDAAYDSIIEILTKTDFPSSYKNQPGPIIEGLEAMKRNGLKNPDILIFNQAKSKIHATLSSPKEKKFASTRFNFSGLGITPGLRKMEQKNQEIFTNNLSLGDSDDLKAVFDKHKLSELQDIAKANNIKPVNAFFKEYIDSPVLTIYLINSIIKKSDGKYELGHKTLPSLFFTLTFPKKPRNCSHITEMDQDRSFYVNEVFLKGLDDEDYDEDEEIILAENAAVKEEK